jgi:membrane protein DedA with SNARE-associated domain
MIKKIFLIIALTFSLQILHAQDMEIPGYVTLPDTATKLTLIEKVERWYEDNMNYWTITALMVVESSFIPFPSEIVIPPAAYIASKPDSELNIFLVIFWGTVGALIGAFINYGLALWLGRPIMYKFADSKLGNLLLLNSQKIRKAEDYFNRRGNISTFVGRLLPGIRQLISIPAGLAKMNLVGFTLYTTLGAGIWNIILAILGYLAHGQADLIKKYSSELGVVFIILVGLALLYFIIKYLKNKKSKGN